MTLITVGGERVNINVCVITHKYLVVPKIMEGMRTACAKKKGLMSQTSQETKNHGKHMSIVKVCIICEGHFISLNRLMNSAVLEVLLKFFICFPISFC